ncbi:MAG: hypothetical protein C0504_13425 [Candidatus Solibacter sp.]|nr:hypothetical protein [Candidatus Solibacter sp.]
MDPEVLSKLQRIAEAGIGMLPVAELANHFIFTRDGMAVLVERRGEGFGGIGSPGRITERGFEPLISGGGREAFVFKGGEEAATAAEADAARRLLADLRPAIE